MDLVIYLLAAFFAGFLLARFMIVVIDRSNKLHFLKGGDVVTITQKDAEEYANLAYGLEELIKERANSRSYQKCRSSPTRKGE